MKTNRKEQAQVTRQTILDAAEQVFYEAGASAATLEEIARRANVTRGAIYWHFADKQEILEAVIDRTVFVYEDAICQVTQKAETLEELCCFTISMLEEIAESTDKQRALSIIFYKREHLETDTGIVAKERATYERLSQALEAFFARTVCNKETGVFTATLLAQSFLFYNYGIIAQFLKYRDKIDLARQAQNYTKLFFQAIDQKKKTANIIAFTPSQEGK
jgi:AcrR family transcriptional regulator